MPASRAAWMVRMERSSSGRPSIDIGMPPRPMALTWTSPMRRFCMDKNLLVYGDPRPPPHLSLVRAPSPPEETDRIQHRGCSIVELSHLEYFVAVAEERHFARAAERMRGAQSGLSASIRSPERELDADRRHRPVRPPRHCSGWSFRGGG